MCKPEVRDRLILYKLRVPCVDTGTGGLINYREGDQDIIHRRRQPGRNWWHYEKILEGDWPVFSILNMAARPPGADEKVPPVPLAIFMDGIRSLAGTEGLITSSSSSELLTMFRNLLLPFGGLLELGERGGSGADAMDFFRFSFSCSFCSESSINDAVEISRSWPCVGRTQRPPQEFVRCKRHRNEPA